MTEAMIAVVFLTACFALALFLYQRYSLALAVSADAREALWARASPGCEGGDLDGRLAGAYGRYESRQRRLVPRYTPHHDTPRVVRQTEVRRARFESSVHLGSREVRYTTAESTACNETPDAPEDELPRASVDTWCRATGLCDPRDATLLAPAGAP